MGTGSFRGVERSRDVTLTPHPFLVSRSKNRIKLYLYSPLGPSWPVKRVKPNFRLHMGRALSQAVNARSFTAEDRVQCHVWPCEICGFQGTETGFYPGTAVFPSLYHSIHVPYPSLSTYSLTGIRLQLVRHRNFPKSYALSEIRENWIRHIFSLIFFVLQELKDIEILHSNAVTTTLQP
jgi:hypothetical protein